MFPLGKVGNKLGGDLALSNDNTMASLDILNRSDLWRVVLTLDDLSMVLLEVLVEVLVRGGFEVRVGVFLCELVLGGFWEGETGVEGRKGWDERQADEQTPGAINVLGVAILNVVFESTKNDEGGKGTDEGAPTLVCKDEAEEGTSSVDVGTVRDDGGTHWVVTTDTDTEDDTGDKDPGQDLVAGEVGRDGDTDDGGDDD